MISLLYLKILFIIKVINRFYNKIDEYNNGINTFFVCSDNMEMLNNIKNKYGNIIILYESNNNILKDFIELMLLSKNNILFGTELSTFTEMAYIINYNLNKKNFNFINIILFHTNDSPSLFDSVVTNYKNETYLN